jgi:arginine N-succinyltransferase
MLMQEGFQFDHEIDILDGGPLMIAKTNQIRTIKNSSLLQVSLTSDSLSEETEYLISNDRLDFRSCFGKLQLISKTRAYLNKDVADALLIKDQGMIRYATFH